MEENIGNESNEGKKKKIIPIVVLVLVVLALTGYFVFGKNIIQNPLNNNTKSVATVNGVIITKATYDTSLAEIVALYKDQGVNVADATNLSKIKEEVLDNLINNELINQEVAAAGIKTTAEEVEKNFQAFLTQSGGAEKFQAELAKNNLSEAQLRENISKQLAAQAYYLQNFGTAPITVSEAEIAQFYEDYSKAQKDSGQTVPTLKDLSAQIKQQLISDKRQTLVDNFIASLRAKATVEITP